MKTKRTVLVAAALWFTAAAAIFAANAQIGTWKLDEAKSTFSPGATKNHTVTYTAEKGGMVMVTVDGIDKSGKTVHWTWEGKFNGQPYKASGNPVADTIAYKPVNDHTNELTMMKGGKATMTVMITVSKDGKSRTVTSSSTDAKGKKHTDTAYYTKS